jgi:hypothetical protein
MARNTAFGTVITKALNHAKKSTNSSQGNDFRENLKQTIISVQEFYYGEFDWPFMRITKENAGKDLAAGQRYYDFPATLSMEGAIRLWYKQSSSIWLPLTQGITPADYTAFDSDADVRAEPALKWDFHGETQFEIWPLPNSNDKDVRFEGLKNLTALVDENDTLDLDDEMVALKAAAISVAISNESLSKILDGMAERRFWGMRQRASKDIQTRIGIGSGEGKARPQTETGWPRIIVAHNPSS